MIQPSFGGMAYRSNSAPPPRAGSRIRWVLGISTYRLWVNQINRERKIHLLSMSKSEDKSACKTMGAPREPSSAIFLTSKVRGRNLVHIASIKNTLCFFAAARRERNSAALLVTGFSQRTFFPACMALRALV
jgi:hypothetical protein